MSVPTGKAISELALVSCPIALHAACVAVSSGLI